MEENENLQTADSSLRAGDSQEPEAPTTATQQESVVIDPQPTVESPLVDEPKEKKKFAFLEHKAFIAFLIVLALITTGALVYLYIQNQNLKKEMSQLVPAPTLTTFPDTPTPTPDPAAGWKTYSLTNFNIKLPANWRHKEGSSNPIQFFNYDSSATRNGHFDPELDKGILKLEIWISENSEGKTLSEFISEKKEQTIDLRGQDYGWTETTTKVGDQNAVKVDDTRPSFVVYTLNPDKTSFYTLAFALDFDNYKDLADQILSTFEFIDETDNTEGWTTYSNKNYNFSFRYPNYVTTTEVHSKYINAIGTDDATGFSITVPIFIQDNPNGLDLLDSYIEYLAGDKEELKKHLNATNTTVGNMDALRVVKDYEHFKQQSTPGYTTYLVNLGNSVLQIQTTEYRGSFDGTITNISPHAENINEYQQILSTFEFLE